jgi:hypothetical protein
MLETSWPLRLPQPSESIFAINPNAAELSTSTKPTFHMTVVRVMASSPESRVYNLTPFGRMVSSKEGRLRAEKSDVAGWIERFNMVNILHISK